MQSSTPVPVDLWLMTEQGVSGTRLCEAIQLLSSDERKRAERFRFDKDRELFQLAHAHLRRVLSRYAPIEPEDWSFLATARGRPYIATEPYGSELFFSLSHTAGLVAVAVSAAADIGVDVENLHRTEDLRGMACDVLNSRERAHLASLPEDEYHAGFLKLWTLKEAYAKAKGLGLALAFDRISFEIRDREISLWEAPEGAPPEPQPAWSFQLHRPTADHQLALAVRGDCRAASIQWMSA